VDPLVGSCQRRAAGRLSACRDELVAVQGTAGRRGVMAGGPECESAGVLVECAELASIAVGGFQVPGDHLVGIERHARSARGRPVGQPLVKVRAV